MNSKRNQILLGVIVFLVGLMALLNPVASIFFQFGSLVILFAGLAFLLLYKTKKKSWSLIFGGYLTYFGTARFLTPVIGQQAVLSIVGAMFFIVPAVIFLILYTDKNKRELLLPASLMLWLGIFLCLKDIPAFAGVKASGLFLICISIAFFMAYTIGKMFIGKWALYFSVIFAVFGIFRIIAVNPFSVLFGSLSSFFAVMLMAISFVIIVKALKKR